MSMNHLNPLNQLAPADHGDPLGSVDNIVSQKVPDGVDRRAFLMRSALIGATAIILDRPISPQLRAAKLAGTPPVPQLSPTLNVVKEQKGPVMTTLDEFYKVGPGPSSSHTIGPMRITYDFYQRCTKLPAGPASQGDSIPGSPIREPQCYRQRTRHGARFARWIGRKRAGDGRSRLS